MAIGEAATGASVLAAAMSNQLGVNITTQALFEGKTGDIYGGWSFYFVRRYLAECHEKGHKDDPMAGYEESINGACLPPGRVTDRLLVYDINRISDDLSDGRDAPVKDGINFKSITLHKAVIGGDPADLRDRKDWPGCVLINLCKMKIHQLELVTCALKNIGVGLFPMEVRVGHGDRRWKYALPDTEMPSFKLRIPHRVWDMQTDDTTGMPVPDGNGGYAMTKTGGMEATVADAMQAVIGQDIMMIHVVDGIEATNLTHAGNGGAVVPEGLVFASTDAVAVDELAARYMFNNVPMQDTGRVCSENGIGCEIIQKALVPHADGKNISTGNGFDSSYARFSGIEHCEKRGLGSRKFYVTGNDLWIGGKLASVGGRLGRVETGAFHELLDRYNLPCVGVHALVFAENFARLPAGKRPSHRLGLP